MVTTEMGSNAKGNNGTVKCGRFLQNKQGEECWNKVVWGLALKCGGATIMFRHCTGMVASAGVGRGALGPVGYGNNRRVCGGRGGEWEPPTHRGGGGAVNRRLACGVAPTSRMGTPPPGHKVAVIVTLYHCQVATWSGMVNPHYYRIPIPIVK